MTEKITNMKAGFFWGFGFSLSCLIVISIYIFTTSMHLDKATKEMYRDNVTSELAEVHSKFEAGVIELFKDERILRVTAFVKNNTDREMYSRNLLIRIFDENDVFISECKKESREIFIDIGKVDYLEAKCRMSAKQLERAHSATAKITL
jgi:hypothetical protein